MRKFPILPSLLAVALAAAVAGCSNDDTDVSAMAGPDETTTAADANDAVGPGATNVPADDRMGATGANTLTVATAEGIDGSFLTDSAGTSLYYVEGDSDGSKCVDECADTWPPFLVVDAMPGDTPGLDAAMVGVVTRQDGSTQVSYNGHPLYRYSGDNGVDSTAGHGVEDQWGHWYLITPAGGEVGEAAETADTGDTTDTADAGTTEGY
jgi:predicted lipoprotein with Yx(FWY)xxD motif